MATAKYNAAHSIKIFKKINGFTVRPFLLPGRFTKTSGYNKNGNEKPEIPPVELFRFLFFLRNPFFTEIGSDAAGNDQSWKNPGRSKKQISSGGTQQHNSPSNSILDGNMKRSNGIIGQETYSQCRYEFENVSM